MQQNSESSKEHQYTQKDPQRFNAWMWQMSKKNLTIDNFRRQMKCIKKVKEDRCQKCLREFNEGWLLKRHLKTHTEEKKSKM